MEKTYSLILNNIKKGSLIKFNNENPIYRILSLSPDGTAEIFPVDFGRYVPDVWYNSFGSYRLPATIDYIGGTRNQQDEMYWCYAYPISREALPSNEQKLQNAPFYNYLQTANVKQTVWTWFEPKDSYSGTWFKITDNPLAISDSYYYKLSLNVVNTGTYHWRPLTLDDVLEYYGKTSITAAEWRKVFEKPLQRSFSTNGLSIYDSADYRNQCLFGTGQYDVGLYDDGGSGIFLPVFKLKLTSYTNWTALSD